MKVKELIEQLNKFNPEEEIHFYSCIETGRSVSVCQDGTMSLDFQDNIDPETGEDRQDGPPQILVLCIDGEETYYN